MRVHSRRDNVATGETPGRKRKYAPHKAARSLSGVDRFLLCNLVIRTGMSEGALAGLFGVHMATVSRHLFTGVWSWTFWLQARFKRRCDELCVDDCRGHYGKTRVQHRTPPSHLRRFGRRVHGLLDAHPVYCGKSSNRDWVRAMYNK